MMRKNKLTRQLALALSCAMIITSLPVMSTQVQATENKDMSEISELLVSGNEMEASELDADLVSEEAGEDFELYSEYYGNSDFYYTGSEIKPTIYYKETAMTEGVDYTAVYEDNVEPGEATVIITGKNSFTGTYELKYNIKPYPLYMSEVTITAKVDGKNIDTDGSVKIPFDGKEHKPVVTITRLVDGKKITLEEGKDYEIDGLDSYNMTSGTVYVNVVGINHYKAGNGFYYTVTPPTVNSCTVEVDDEIIYDGREHNPVKSIKIGSFEFKEGESFTVEYEDGNVSGGTHHATIIGCQNDASVPALTGEYEFTFEIKPIESITEEDFELCSEYNVNNVFRFYYTGKEIKPSIYYKEIAMAEGVDYTAVYKDNVEMGEATVIITGKNSFTGTYELKYNIEPYPLCLSEVTITAKIDGKNVYTDGSTKIPFDGKEHKPEVVVTRLLDGRKITLEEGKDYEITGLDNYNLTSGAVSFNVSGLNHYSDPLYFEYTITPPSLDACTVSLDKNSFVYASGKEQKPQISVSCNGVAFTEGGSYDVTWTYEDLQGKKTENINSFQNAGTYYGTITGKTYEKWFYKSFPSLSGTKTVTYQIQPLDISNAEIILPDQEFIYRGEAVAPIPTVKVNGEDVVQNCWDYSSWNSIANYEVTYTGNTAAGTATMTIKGSGNCTGSVSKTFKILPSLQTCQISLSKDSYDYNSGIACVPEVTVRDGNKILREDKDYKLTYSNNVNAGYAMVTITPAGDYRDEITKEYIIQPNSIENAVVTLGETIYSYDGSAKKPQVVSVVLNGKTLVAGTDYEIGYTNNINEGTAYVIITGVGNYTATLSQSFRILPYNAGMDSVYEKGDTLISGDYIYTIMDDEEKEVELSGSSNKKLTNVVVPKTVQDENGVVYTVTSVGQKAFYKNNKIKSVVIGNEVRSIEDYAFYGCKNVSSIKIGKKLEIVGASAFRKCTKLTGITLPKSLDEIGKNAFYGCKKLKTITINANTVVDISDNAMKGISKKAVIKVPSKLVKKYKKNLKSKTGFTKTMTVKKK